MSGIDFRSHSGMGVVWAWSGLVPGCQVLALAVGVSAGLPGFSVNGLSHCRVAAFGLSGLRELDVFFITFSHCAREGVPYFV
jgi:hypothetical protein